MAKRGDEVAGVEAHYDWLRSVSLEHRNPTAGTAGYSSGARGGVSIRLDGWSLGGGLDGLATGLYSVHERLMADTPVRRCAPRCRFFDTRPSDHLQSRPAGCCVWAAGSRLRRCGLIMPPFVTTR